MPVLCISTSKRVLHMPFADRNAYIFPNSEVFIQLNLVNKNTQSTSIEIKYLNTGYKKSGQKDLHGRLNDPLNY